MLRKQSILIVGALPDPVTDRGRAIAQLIMGGLEKNDKTHFPKASAELETLIGKENLGGSNSAMHWMTGILLAPDDSAQASIINNALNQQYFDFSTVSGLLFGRSGQAVY